MIRSGSTCTVGSADATCARTCGATCQKSLQSENKKSWCGVLVRLCKFTRALNTGETLFSAVCALFCKDCVMSLDVLNEPCPCWFAPCGHGVRFGFPACPQCSVLAWVLRPWCELSLPPSICFCSLGSIFRILSVSERPCLFRYPFSARVTWIKILSISVTHKLIQRASSEGCMGRKDPCGNDNMQLCIFPIFPVNFQWQEPRSHDMKCPLQCPQQPWRCTTQGYFGD